MTFVPESTVVGVLKGFDQLQNLVLDDVREESTGVYMAGLPFPGQLDVRTDLFDVSAPATDGRPARTLGLVVVRGPTLITISPVDGYEGES